jgi:tRNA pseudouridine38-40 synthase
MRYFLEIAFDGTPFYGWQIQAEGPTVQAVMDAALSKLFRQAVFCTGCGRTDSGVHARQFFLHFDSPSLIEDYPLFIRKMNGILPHEISVKEVLPVENTAHARFSALSRTYEYVFTHKKDPFLRNYSAFIWKQPDIDAMNKACKMMIGIRDFKAFSRVNDLKHHLCDLQEAYFYTEGHTLIFRVRANRFLRNMVRAMTGTLMDLGNNKITETQLLSILESGVRSNAGQSVPASGLFLTQITYPDSIFNKIHAEG